MLLYLAVGLVNIYDYNPKCKHDWTRSTWQTIIARAEQISERIEGQSSFEWRRSASSAARASIKQNNKWQQQDNSGRSAAEGKPAPSAHWKHGVARWEWVYWCKKNRANSSVVTQQSTMNQLETDYASRNCKEKKDRGLEVDGDEVDLEVRMGMYGRADFQISEEELSMRRWLICFTWLCTSLIVDSYYHLLVYCSVWCIHCNFWPCCSMPLLFIVVTILIINQSWDKIQYNPRDRSHKKNAKPYVDDSMGVLDPKSFF